MQYPISEDMKINASVDFTQQQLVHIQKGIGIAFFFTMLC